jgi:hypothetical protein
MRVAKRGDIGVVDKIGLRGCATGDAIFDKDETDAIRGGATFIVLV